MATTLGELERIKEGQMRSLASLCKNYDKMQNSGWTSSSSMMNSGLASNFMQVVGHDNSSLGDPVITTSTGQLWGGTPPGHWTTTNPNVWIGDPPMNDGVVTVPGTSYPHYPGVAPLPDTYDPWQRRRTLVPEEDNDPGMIGLPDGWEPFIPVDGGPPPAVINPEDINEFLRRFQEEEVERQERNVDNEIAGLRTQIARLQAQLAHLEELKAAADKIKAEAAGLAETDKKIKELKERRIELDI
jgi:hypothetical protein